ncbi:hypothetical protein EYC84_004113 [Monilinia fructicola]|uniref:Uncharacterized protein n=1 Tax=Monilinia fructicola TaxID=38448 RepID=A0A5M9K032_MONFR|nr:hypothetical protein EYC84_004113 [Monilinia fructicola]
MRGPSGFDICCKAVASYDGGDPKGGMKVDGNTWTLIRGNHLFMSYMDLYVKECRLQRRLDSCRWEVKD